MREGIYMETQFDDFNFDEWEILPDYKSESSSSSSSLIDSISFSAQKAVDEFYRILYRTPAVMELIKSSNPRTEYIVDLTDEQREKLASGALKFLRRKIDGALLGTLNDPNAKFSQKVSLKEIKTTPELTSAMNSVSYQMQLAKLAKKIEAVQEEVRSLGKGLENDRLAMAYSCQQNFLQIRHMKNENLRNISLLNLIMCAENSRNTNMLSLQSKMDFVEDHPESIIKKVMNPTTMKDIDTKLNEIRDSLYAINISSLVEVASYQILGEPESAQESLKYYARFIESTFMEKEGLLERLNTLDESPNNYWTTMIPNLAKQILDYDKTYNALPEGDETK